MYTYIHKQANMLEIASWLHLFYLEIRENKTNSLTNIK